ncbi:ATP-grasp domain-containing protein [Fulvimarina sp. MAC3]|uniref:ATP-grasp domain-containing protein n=1 Tax=Fulvimarina sp. MAC3 TaxID=3148887 RepID=UPI0031FD7D6A
MSMPLDGPAVIVDPYSSGAFFASAFEQVGVPVIAVMSAATPPEVYAPSFRPQDFDMILVAEEGDLSGLVDRLKSLKPRCILTGCESGVELTDAISPIVRPERANSPEKAQARRHKGEMARAVEAAGIPSMRQICTASAEEVAAWIAREGLKGRDLVMKPPKSASTDGVVKVSGGAGWRELFDRMVGSVNRLGTVNDNLVVQEFLSGTEYAVDTATYAGIHSIASVCRYNKTDNGPFMAIYDTMEWIPSDAPHLPDLRDYAFRVLDAVGMHYGTNHIEIMVTKDGPRLIEIGARPHGGGHPRFCRHATGDSQVDRIARRFAEQGLSEDSYELKTNLTIVFLLCRTGGVVTNRAVLNGIADLESHFFSRIDIADGQTLAPTCDLFASLDMGFVALAHDDPEQISADCRRIRAWEVALFD